MVFAYFLGMCSYLAVSKTVKTADGLGKAVIFVLTISVPINYLIDQYLLAPGALTWIGPQFQDVNLSFLTFIMFIAVIASMVQLVEMIVEKLSPTFIWKFRNFSSTYCGKLCNTWRLTIYATKRFYKYF